MWKHTTEIMGNTQSVLDRNDLEELMAMVGEKSPLSPSPPIVLLFEVQLYHSFHDMFSMTSADASAGVIFGG